jgi:hypothetical protein
LCAARTLGRGRQHDALRLERRIVRAQAPAWTAASR